MHYLDNAATTPVIDSVADIADKTLREHFANPSSLYALGADSEAVITQSRRELAKALSCAEKEIVFTSCGTEGNNLAIIGACNARKNWANHIVVSAYEHPSVRNVCEYLKSSGYSVTEIKPSIEGNVDVLEIINAVTPKTALVAAMHINNETGAIIDVEELARGVKKANSRTAVHVDGVQAFGKIEIKLSNSNIDSYAVSGHKINAPKGVGALYLKGGFNIKNVMHGGSQERGLRPGTENTAYIAALGLAAQIASKNTLNPVVLKQLLVDGIINIGNIEINSPQNAHPSIVNFSVLGVKSEVLLHFLEEKSIYVSSGSACSKGAKSHTLTAMGLDAKRIDSSLRVSFGRQNTQQDVVALIDAIKIGQKTLAR